MPLASFKHAAHSWANTFVRELEAGLFPQADDEATEFLPNFCSGWAILNVAIVAEMLAFIIALVTRRLSFNLLQDLLIISLFVQWIALASAAALCLTRKHLNRLPPLRALGMAYLLLLCTTFVVSEVAIWVLWAAGTIHTLRPEWYGYFHIQNLSVSAIVNALALRYFLAKHRLKQRTLSEAQAKIEALQSRIRPHFVFNSLNIIASLTRSAPDKAETSIEDMADLFRMMLSHNETLVPVKNDIEVAKKYLGLESLRLDNRLTVSWDIGKFPRKAVMPVLTLQPLLENAIQHGIEPLPSGGNIDIRLWEEEDHIHIRLVNPIPQKTSKRTETTHNMSLENIRSRFLVHYGEAAKLQTGEENGQFVVNVVLPTRGGKP
jgi:two-component system, LytTR family, sensor histidine kinase AlgZ